eukprot:222374-Pleurochrysis_carterae.AAC.2
MDCHLHLSATPTTRSDRACLAPHFPAPAEEYRPGQASENSYDPELVTSELEYTSAVALTHLLHCPDKGTTWPCPRCQARLAAALWERTNLSPSRSR